MFQFSQLPPLALYIHFPWCVRKCPYCDFNSHELAQKLPESDYIDALIADLEQELPRIWGRSIVSIFMGGGTPSLFSPHSLDRLMAALRARLNFTPDIEITLEANPGSVEQGRFSEYRDVGINRLSIGVQSFHSQQLAELGRIHDRAEAIRAAEQAHYAGFDNFNLDLMFALPKQDAAQARQDLQTAIALQPGHLSYYQLTIEPNTLFHHRPPPLPDADSAWDMQETAQELLAAAGYTQYEVSAYAQAGNRCQHNLNYWHFGDYLGIGAGAHAKVSDAATQSIERRWKTRQPKHYLQHAGSAQQIAGTQRLGVQDAVLEFMINALRLTEGIETAVFSHHTGLPLIVAEPGLREAQRKGWLNWDQQRLLPSTEGKRFLNDLLELFVTHD